MCRSVRLSTHPVILILRKCTEGSDVAYILHIIICIILIILSLTLKVTAVFIVLNHSVHCRMQCTEYTCIQKRHTRYYYIFSVDPFSTLVFIDFVMDRVHSTRTRRRRRRRASLTLRSTLTSRSVSSSVVVEKVSPCLCDCE